MKVALQLYGLREYLGIDQISTTLKKVKEMGYDGVEWISSVPGLTPREMYNLTVDSGLEFFSVLTNMVLIKEGDRNRLKEFALLGCKYMPISYLSVAQIAGGEEYREVCDLIRRYAKMAKEEGIRILYHNHDHDMVRLNENDINSKRKLDVLFEDIDKDLLGAELDTCWLYSGGVDPIDYVKRYADRMPILHLKDCVKDGGRKSFKPLGKGVLDFHEILKVNKAEWVCIEQDKPSDGLNAFDCHKISIDYLKSIKI